MSMTQELETALAVLAPRLTPDGAEIAGLKRLSGGASQETWAFDALDRSGARRELILRRSPGGAAPTSPAALGLETEAALIRAAGRAGVPVPEVVHVCAPGDGIGQAFVMARIPGETIARKILRDPAYARARPRLAAQCGVALAGIHAVPAGDLPALPVSFGTDQLERYQEVYRSSGCARPVFELAFRWLREHAPEPRPAVLVHGDFRLGNLIVDEDGLASVLDWELAHLGDPREDLAWVCINSWRFGKSENRVGGFGQLDDLLEAYSAGAPSAVRAAEIDWFEMLGSLKWGVMCLIMYEAFRSGADPSVERAAIGRRASETEIDLIHLLERAEADA